MQRTIAGRCSRGPLGWIRNCRRSWDYMSDCSWVRCVERTDGSREPCEKGKVLIGIPPSNSRPAPLDQFECVTEAKGGPGKRQL